MKTKLVIPVLTVLALLLAAPCAIAQETGVSHPEALDDNISALPVPAGTDCRLSPRRMFPWTSILRAIAPAPANPSAIAPQLLARDIESRDTATDPLLVPVQPAQLHPVNRDFTVTDDDPTSGVVMGVPSGPNELPIATMLHARLSETISTRETAAGTRFTAKLTADVLKHGRVMLPVGTIISGRVTQVHSGRSSHWACSHPFAA